MKKIVLFLVLMTAFSSCSIGESVTYTNYVLPVDSYIMPETFTVGDTYEIKLKYQKPTFCYNYGGVYYSYSENNTRTIGVYANVKDGESCTEVLPPLSEVSFNFKPTKVGQYTFKFYKGDDDEGNKLFEEVEFEVETAN